MKKYFYKLVIVSQLCVLFTGCATIIHGRRQNVSVSTNHPGATISDGVNTVTAPAMLNLKRDRDYLLTISKPGFETETVKVTHVIDGLVALNLLTPGVVIGWGVDAISGAQWRLEPETISVNLRPLNESDKKNPGETLESKLQEIEVLKQKNLITDEESQSMRALTIQSFELSKSAR